MARYGGPKCRLCRREGIKLYLKGERCEGAKCPITRQRSFPGQHGVSRRRRRPSAYSLQLREKQKVKRIYGILERQFRKYVDAAKVSKGNAGPPRRPASTAKRDEPRGEPGTILLQKLELRLDNVVYQLGLARSRSHARQLLRQGKFVVNGEKVDIPSFELSIGDKVGFADKPLEIRKNLIIPGWLSWGKKSSVGMVKRIPEREEIEQDIDESIIMEYYSR